MNQDMDEVWTGEVFKAPDIYVRTVKEPLRNFMQWPIGHPDPKGEYTLVERVVTFGTKTVKLVWAENNDETPSPPDDEQLTLEGLL